MFSFLKALFGGSAKTGCACHGGSGSLRELEGFVDYVVRALVDDPSSIRVYSEEGAEASTIKIECKKEDIGKIVGKRGKTIMAIRSLVSGAAGRMRRRVSVEVVE
ncbi:MAG: KH domain-containing protein [Victivallaceae bacterium]|nr:KH domain-containing protein [Victivallaceae bacterium]